MEMGGVEKQDELGEKGSIGFLYLNIGLQVLRLFALTLMLWPLWAHGCDLCFRTACC